MSETNELPAGRELDRMVAERVFYHTPGWEDGMLLGCGESWECPHYSTDHNAAATVLAWIREQSENRLNGMSDVEEAIISVYCEGNTEEFNEDGEDWERMSFWWMLGADLPLTWCRIALALAGNEGKQ